MKQGFLEEAVSLSLSLSLSLFLSLSLSLSLFLSIFESLTNCSSCLHSETNDKQQRLIWAFLAPLIVVVVLNSIMFAIVIHTVMKLLMKRRATISPGALGVEERAARIKKAVQASFSFLVLMGIGWIFGVLAIDSARVTFQYIFTILNVLQGLFIFILHCYRE
jgi:hypothetical protein